MRRVCQLPFFSIVEVLLVVLIAIVSEFTSLEQVSSLTAENVQMIWKNMLCCLGNINNISPVNHAEGIKSLVNVYETLEIIRAMQSYEGAVMPPLFDFASWIFQAADLGL